MRSQEYTTYHERLNEVLRSEGKLCLPNVEEITQHEHVIRQLCHMNQFTDIKPYRFLIREYDPPKNGTQTKEAGWYPKIFLNTRGMAGRFDGSGIILCNNKAWSFHFCDHVWDESGSNHNRGWYRKVCTKCGFDASIDSGD
jgi:hypothetical protein